MVRAEREVARGAVVERAMGAVRVVAASEMAAVEVVAALAAVVVLAGDERVPVAWVSETPAAAESALAAVVEAAGSRSCGRRSRLARAARLAGRPHRHG